MRGESENAAVVTSQVERRQLGEEEGQNVFLYFLVFY
jgi:hypothetical protein